jgi:hypothetical protein
LNDWTVALAVLALTFGGTLFGMWLGGKLPEHHLSASSRDTIKVGMGLTATMTALVLGLVTASSKSQFDELDSALRQQATNVLSLDRSLARYGPETSGVRDSIRRAVAARVESEWPEEGLIPGAAAARVATGSLEKLEDAIAALPVDTAEHRRFQAEAMDRAGDLLRTRWVVLESGSRAVPSVFLGILACWLTLIFASFGLLAPRNPTTVGVLLLSSLSVSAAMFLILELAQPLDGVIKVSSGPLRFALSQLGQ